MESSTKGNTLACVYATALPYGHQVMREPPIMPTDPQLREGFVKSLAHDILEGEDGRRLGKITGRIYVLIELAWDYLDTVANILIQMKVKPTRKAGKRLQAYHEAYKRYRTGSVGIKGYEETIDLALDFLDEHRRDIFDRLADSLTADAAFFITEAKDQRPLYVAVQMALTIMDALKKVARQGDEFLRGYGISTDYGQRSLTHSCGGIRIPVASHGDCMLVPNEFLVCYNIVPLLMGNAHDRCPRERMEWAKVIANKINNTDFNII